MLQNTLRAHAKARRRKEFLFKNNRGVFAPLREINAD